MKTQAKSLNGAETSQETFPKSYVHNEWQPARCTSTTSSSKLSLLPSHAALLCRLLNKLHTHTQRDRERLTHVNRPVAAALIYRPSGACRHAHTHRHTHTDRERELCGHVDALN